MTEVIDTKIEPSTATALGIPGATGAVYADDNGNFYTQAPDEATFVDVETGTANAEEEASIGEPAPMPQLQELTVGQQQNLQLISMDLLKAVNDQKIKLTPEQQKQLTTLSATKAQPQDWPKQMQAVLRGIDHDGTLSKKMKAAGILDKHPDAYNYAMKITRKSMTPAPKGPSLKKDPKTGQVYTKQQKEGKKSGQMVYISGTGEAGDTIRMNELGEDQETAQKERGLPETARYGDYHSLRTMTSLATQQGDVAPAPKSKAKLTDANTSLYGMNANLNLQPHG